MRMRQIPAARSSAATTIKALSTLDRPRGPPTRLSPTRAPNRRAGVPN
jgi:hypothetical protein